VIDAVVAFLVAAVAVVVCFVSVVAVFVFAAVVVIVIAIVIDAAVVVVVVAVVDEVRTSHSFNLYLWELPYQHSFGWNSSQPFLPQFPVLCPLLQNFLRL
jgi:hypothetical protein